MKKCVCVCFVFLLLVMEIIERELISNKPQYSLFFYIFFSTHSLGTSLLLFLLIWKLTICIWLQSECGVVKHHLDVIHHVTKCK